MQITFLMPDAADGHYYKRVRILIRLGAKARVLAFERKYHKERKYNHPYTSLGKFEHSNYFRRLLPIFRVVPIVRKYLRSSDVTYAFGLDMLLLCWLSGFGLRKKPKIVFEVCDILPIMIGNSLKSRAIRLAERILIQKACVLVVTSKAFLTGYYKKIQGLTQLRYLVIENKLDSEEVVEPVSSPRKLFNTALRIGYFGGIRCQRSLEILKSAVRNGKGRIHVYVRGIPIGDIDLEVYAKENPGIEYGGAYLSPDDLPYLYEKIDIVWVCFTYIGEQVGNWMWARTNRFYEACFYKKPIIARLGTEDGRVVTEKGLGLCLDLSDVNACVEQILAIGPDDLQRWHNNLKKLPQNIYIYIDEHQQLLNILGGPNFVKET